jgi:hypothetical protein
MQKEPTFTAFAGTSRIVSADLVSMLIQTKARLAADEADRS